MTLRYSPASLPCRTGVDVKPEPTSLVHNRLQEIKEEKS